MQTTQDIPYTDRNVILYKLYSFASKILYRGSVSLFIKGFNVLPSVVLKNFRLDGQDILKWRACYFQIYQFLYCVSYRTEYPFISS